MSGKDPITILNEEATQNLNTQDLHIQDYTVYGEYEFIPIPAHKQQEMREALTDLNNAMLPTLSQIRQKDNIMEIQDRIYRKFKQYETELNTCVFLSKTNQDSVYCSDKFLSQLRGEGYKYALDVLKDY